MDVVAGKLVTRSLSTEDVRLVLDGRYGMVRPNQGESAN